ncbi:MAG: hypothetical protein K8U03_22610 [Planctomycetia bacterium]|nr:hypothetical protein [Planctomycetia bacterium]
MLERFSFANLTLLAALCLCLMPARQASAQSPLVADLHVHMEAGKLGDAMTVELLNAMTRGDGGTWRIRRGREWTDTPLTEFTVAPARGRLPGSVSVNGVVHENKEDKHGWACELATPVRCITYTFKTPQPKVSVGFFLEYHGTKKWTPLDLVSINSSDGDFVVLNTREHPQTPGFRVHTGDRGPNNERLGSRAGPIIPVEDGKLYWVSMRFTQNGNSSLALFDPKTFEQIGPTSTLKLNSNTPARSIMIGRCDNHGVVAPTVVFWNDLVVDWTTARFPLLP